MAKAILKINRHKRIVRTPMNGSTPRFCHHCTKELEGGSPSYSRTSGNTGAKYYCIPCAKLIRLL